MSFNSNNVPVIWFISIRTKVNSANPAVPLNIWIPYRKTNPIFAKSNNALGISLANMNPVLSFLSRNTNFIKKFLVFFSSLIILLFWKISNFDIITLTMNLSACTKTSLLRFLIFFILLLPRRAKSIMKMKMISIILNVNRPRFIITKKNMVPIFMIFLTIGHSMISWTMLLRLSHPFCNILFDCPVHSVSTILLSALRYLPR